jgi:Putative auto-transporter adhesin, head GIN domain
MMKKTINAVVVVCLLITLHSCRKINGRGPVVTTNRTASNFTAISVSLGAKVYVTQGSDYKVEVLAQQNIQDIIRTSVENGELQLNFHRNYLVTSKDDVIINVTAPSINRLQVSGSSDLFTVGNLVTDNLALDVSGSGNISIPQVEATSVQGKVSGNGNISILAGHATDESFKVSGSGDIDALNLLGVSGNTSSSGSGKTRVNVSQNLKADISGSGTVYYRGNPVIDSHTSGSGKLVHVD